MRLPQFIGCEGSSQGPDGYPVEIAWSYADGAIDSRLVNPCAVAGWDDWDPVGPQIHGLTREYLRRHGHHPLAVAHRMNRALQGGTLYTDAWDYHERWICRLFVVAGITRRFVLVDAERLWRALAPGFTCDPSVPRAAAGLPEALGPVQGRRWALEALRWRARVMTPGAHRAGDDLRQMLDLYRLVAEEQAA